MTPSSAMRPEGAIATSKYGLSDPTCLRGGVVLPYAHLDWVQAAERLSGASCDELIAACREFPLAPPVIVGQAEYGGHRQLEARKIEPNPRTAWAFELLCAIAGDATQHHFDLALTSITRAPQYVEYTPGCGHFGWHNDYSHGLVDAPRKLTIIVQLSDPADYEGGLLQTFGITVEDLPRERGTILAFPSLVYHQITPVTRGLRRALVAWIAGPRIR